MTRTSHQKSSASWSPVKLIALIQVVFALVIWACLFASPGLRTAAIAAPNGILNIYYAITLATFLCFCQLVLSNRQLHSMTCAIVSVALVVLSMYLGSALMSRFICPVVRKGTESSVKCDAEDRGNEIAASVFALLQMIISIIQMLFLAVIHQEEKALPPPGQTVQPIHDIPQQSIIRQSKALPLAAPEVHHQPTATPVSQSQSANDHSHPKSEY